MCIHIYKLHLVVKLRSFSISFCVVLNMRGMLIYIWSILSADCKNRTHSLNVGERTEKITNEKRMHCVWFSNNHHAAERCQAIRCALELSLIHHNIPTFITFKFIFFYFFQNRRAVTWDRCAQRTHEYEYWNWKTEYVWNKASYKLPLSASKMLHNAPTACSRYVFM